MGEVLNIRTLGLLKSQALSAEYWFSSRGRCGLPGEMCCSVCESGWAGKARVIIHLYVVIGCYHSVSGLVNGTGSVNPCGSRVWVLKGLGTGTHLSTRVPGRYP
jgi:hypothetical protein